MEQAVKAGQAGASAAKAGVAAKASAGAASGGVTVALELVKKGKDKLQELAERNNGNAENENKQSLGCFGMAACVIFIPCLLVFLILFGGGHMSIGNKNLSDAVIAYMPEIEEACRKYEIPEYAPLVAAIMMQESGGRAESCNGDVMQAAESQGWPAGTYIEPKQSIDYGVQHFKACLQLAGMPEPSDIPGISLALQGYNCAKRS